MIIIRNFDLLQKQIYEISKDKTVVALVFYYLLSCKYHRIQLFVNTNFEFNRSLKDKLFNYDRSICLTNNTTVVNSRMMAVETECLADLLQLSLSEQQKSRAILPVV